MLYATEHPSTKIYTTFPPDTDTSTHRARAANGAGENVTLWPHRGIMGMHILIVTIHIHTGINDDGMEKHTDQRVASRRRAGWRALH